MKKIITATLAVCLIASTSISYAQFNLKDLKKDVEKAAVKEGTKVLIALLVKMAIDFHTKKVAEEKVVIEKYKKENKKIPDNPTAAKYESVATPGKIIKPGKKVTISSTIEVVLGKKKKQALIEETLTIYDNEDKSKPLKSLTKAINASKKKGGIYKNTFSFVPPIGMPQGIYGIKTSLQIDGKTVDSQTNDLQLVMIMDDMGNAELVAMADIQ